jgi:predicted ATPase
MKSYIATLSAQNIGLFSQLNIQFNPRMNILIGKNGSGKTSILRLITYCLSESTDNLIHSRWRSLAEVWAETYWKGKPYKSGFSLKEKVNEGYRQLPFSSENPFQNPFSLAPNNLYVIGASRYFDYKRIEGMKREAVGEERKQYYRKHAIQFLDGTLLPDIKQWMINRYFSIDKDWAEIQRQNWEHIMSLLPTFAPAEMDFQFVRIERDLEPIFKLNGKACYLEELASSFKSVLAIVFSIIDWCEGVNEGIEQRMQNAWGTVLIDEVDAHLHPEWQTQIIKHLKTLFPQIQLIVTTHSPLVIASAEANEVIKIPPHHGEVNLKPENQSYQGWQLEVINEEVMNATVLPTDIDNQLAKIEKAYRDNDLQSYNAYLTELATVLHPNDPILKVYKLKKSNLILNLE